MDLLDVTLSINMKQTTRLHECFFYPVIMQHITGK
jgi:hypothetical protein